MAEDRIQDDENLIDAQIVEHEHINGSDIEESCTDDSETRTLIYLDGQFKGQTDELMVNKVESTGSEDDAIIETTEIRLKAASGCGHILHISNEAGLACLSCRRLGKEPLILCAECAKSPENICFICNAPCCYNCRRETRFIDGEKRVVCKACIKSTLRIRLLKQIVKWLLIGAGVLYVIMF